jgi:VanZ family protein
MRPGKNALAFIVMAVCMMAAGFLLIRESPRINPLNLLPRRWGLWLDTVFDFRTYLLAVILSLVPAGFFFSNGKQRRRFLIAILGFLLVGEICQIWVPTRTFSFWDLLYSVLGVLTVEGITLTMRATWLVCLNRIKKSHKGSP